ncbi:RNA polymerase sigma factor [Dyadobacter tibetensis]|uniref:RNA polymerase sigma factor n=1 Tax=Dyadobacter tibetensis TaxID=1211851 RepID=UPI0004725591|nr:sigma-70 family RNA polymerase sigma factor [Dyadobacter tibetensis]
MDTVLTEAEDQSLWISFKNGDSQAYAMLYQRYVRVLYAYGYKLLPDKAIIEDLIQDLFIDLWQSRTGLSDVVAPKFYLFRALRRRIYRIAKQDQQLYKIDLEDSDQLPISLPKEFYIVEEESTQRMEQDLARGLKNLPVRQYEVLILRYYQDLSYAEIAGILAINEQSVRNLIHRGLSKLRQLSISLIVLLFLL